MKALADSGFYGLCITKEADGKGEGMRAFAGVVEELAGACASTAMIYVMHVSAAQAIATSAILGERDSILKEIAAGKHLTTLAFSESGSRRQVDGIAVAIIECAVILIVTDPGAGMLENALTRIHDLKLLVLLRLVFRYSVDLFRVKHGVNAMDHPPRLFGLGLWIF